jgi:hypothetical protein
MRCPGDTTGTFYTPFTITMSKEGNVHVQVFIAIISMVVFVNHTSYGIHHQLINVLTPGALPFLRITYKENGLTYHAGPVRIDGY